MSAIKAPEISLERRTSNAGPLKKISSSDLLGKSFVLLAGSEGYAWCDAGQAIRPQLSGPSLEIYRVGSKELRDPDGRFNAEFGVTSAGAVLVSPDGTIAWSAVADEPDPQAALARAFSISPDTTPEARVEDAPESPPRPKPVLVSVNTAPANDTPPARPSVSTLTPLAVYPTGGFYNPFARPTASTANMKLFIHPASVTSRTVRLFIAESGLDIEEEVVDLRAGEHRQADFTARNPTQLVPVLQDGDFLLTESSAILKYLADKTHSPAYPSNIVKRAKIDEMMDWLNTQFMREWAYNFCYPQLFPHHKRRSDEAHAGAVEWGKQNSQKWLQVLNDHWIGNNQYLCGNQITIADYFGAIIVTLGDAIHVDFSKYPNVDRWLKNMRGLKSWDRVNETFSGFVSSTKGKPFETV
jgi:glutathione S-transferase